MNAPHEERQLLAGNGNAYSRYSGTLYLSIIIGLALSVTLIQGSMIRWDSSPFFVAFLWLLGFFSVILNLSYNFIVTIGSFFLRPTVFPEAQLTCAPLTAVLYVVKNEGEGLRHRMQESYAGNCAQNIHLWLISNSDNEQSICAEKAVIDELQLQFGENCVHYYQPSDNPTGRKHLAIQKWSMIHQEYQYIMVCDADTILHHGMLKKLIAKAEHSDNREIMVFQSHMVMRGSVTRFARFVEPGQNLVGSAFRRVNACVFGRSPYYGHSALIRRHEFLQLKVPDHVLSHDLWETAAIDTAGSRVVLCEDATSEEMLPQNYIEDRARTRRWILGTMEVIPLLFNNGFSIGTKFYLFVPLYLYFIQPVFLSWMLLGLLAHNSLSGPLIAVQPLLIGGAAGIDLEMGGMCVTTLLVVWLYHLPHARSVKDFLLLIREIFIGTVVIVNNIVYVSWYVVASPWLQRRWMPMKKQPIHSLSFSMCFWRMLPTTLAGFVLALLGGLISPTWTILASPILISFVLGSVTVYWTAKTCSSEKSMLSTVMVRNFEG